MNRLANLFAWTAGRRAKWLVLAFWLVVAVAAVPFANKLTSVESNDAVNYLPGNAEATKALDLVKQFPEGQTTSAVIVYYRESGLTAQDKAKAGADRSALDKLRLTGAYPATPLVVSQDGKAALFTLPFDSEKADWDKLPDLVKSIRGQTESGTNGMEVKVTGPAGGAADAAKVFNDINGTLLLATVGIVTILLLLTYRSPFLWLFPLISVGLADRIASGVIYGAGRAGLTVTAYGAGILIVLLYGAGTDYALLLISRYREELRRHEDKHAAMQAALRQAGPTILASCATVTISLLCLLVAQLNSTAGLGPVSAIGIVVTFAAMITLLPVLLVIAGRRVFWPFVPNFGSATHATSSFWSRVGRAIDHRPRWVWLVTSLLLVVLAAGLFDFKSGLSQADSYRTKPESVVGQELLAKSFPSGTSQPATVIVNPAANATKAHEAIASMPEVAAVGQIETSGDLAKFDVTLKAAPSTQAAFDAIEHIRQVAKASAGSDALVGGMDAVTLDTNNASDHDQKLIIPLVLVVVLVILGLLLRAITAPVVLIVTVILSYAAALGASTLVFNHVFGFAGQDVSVPLLTFIFLVALGIDYNIFLMARVREEAEHAGTRAGMLKGLAVTGGVITSAGLVLAGTFAVLAILPLVIMSEIGFTVAFGVLLDTLIVRSVLVPALTLDIGRRMWWPSRLAHRAVPMPEAEAEAELVAR